MKKKLRRSLRGALLWMFWAVLSPIVRMISKPSRVFLTSTRSDGGGAQWHGRFSVMAFADEHNMSYVPSRIDHIMPKGSMKTLELWNNLFTGDFIVPPTLPPPRKTDALAEFLRALLQSFFSNKKVLLDVGHFHLYTDIHPEKVSRSLQRHRMRYNNPKRLPNQSTRIPKIAMHVRRGLSWEPNFTANRITDDMSVLRNLKCVITRERITSGTLFSAVQNDNLASKLPSGFHFDSQADEFAVIHSLINAQAMIMGKSCLSYISAAFAQGTVYYEDFFHPPLPGWVTLESSCLTKPRN